MNNQIDLLSSTYLAPDKGTTLGRYFWYFPIAENVYIFVSN